jgi:hypothetical protein
VRVPAESRPPITAMTCVSEITSRAASATSAGLPSAPSSSETKLTVRPPARPAGLRERQLLAVDDVCRRGRPRIGQQRVDRQRVAEH